MIYLGYAAMVGLGLLPLAAFAQIFGVQAERTFWLPTPVALVVAFVLGLSVCLFVGRVLGLLHFRQLNSYEERRTAEAESEATRRRRRRTTRVRRGRLARN